MSLYEVRFSTRYFNEEEAINWMVSRGMMDENEIKPYINKNDYVFSLQKYTTSKKIKMGKGVFFVMSNDSTFLII